MNRIFFGVGRDPLTILAFLISFGLAAACAAYFPVGPGRVALIFGAGLLTFLAWPVVSVLTGRADLRIAMVEAARVEQLFEERNRKLDDLCSEFDELGSETARAQISDLSEKYRVLADVVGARLRTGELTYRRYLGMAEQVFLSALDNLNDAAIAMRSISAIDREGLEERLAQLRGVPEDAGGQHAAPLEKRLELFDAQQMRIAELLDENEQAMTVLVRASTELANARTTRGEACLSADEAIAELERLAKSSRRYARRD